VHGEVSPTTGYLQASHIEVSTTLPAQYKLSGITVDARNAEVRGGVLASGARVVIQGTISQGVLVARQIETPDGRTEFEFHGIVSELNLTAQAQAAIQEALRLGGPRIARYEATRATINQGLAQPP
jgi:hypothetical protein